MSRVVEIFPDSESLVEAAARRLVDTIRAAVAARDRALIVLTGGSNGIGLLRSLAGHDVDWPKVHLFWGDERYVPEDDDERNEKQAREALLDRVDIPSSQVHPMPASDGEFGTDLVAAALAYEQLLAANAGPGHPVPNFDVHLLGWARRATSTRSSPIPRPCWKPPGWSSLSRTPQAAAAANHVDAAGRSAVPRGVVDGIRFRQGGGGRRRHRGAPPVSIPAAGAVGLDTTLWLLDEEAAAKLPARPGS